MISRPVFLNTLTLLKSLNIVSQDKHQDYGVFKIRCADDGRCDFFHKHGVLVKPNQIYTAVRS